VFDIWIEKSFSKFSLNLKIKTNFKKVALFGPSGSGKSLSLKLISGFISPDKGYINIDNILFFDKDKKINLPPHKRKVGYVFQDFLLFPHMTVFENLKFFSKDISYLDYLIKLFEIKDILTKYPSEISGGQKQRVAIVRALSLHPKVLLLDEPFSALNEALREKFLYFLHDVFKKININVIFVSHNFEEVYSLCDYFIFLEKGKVVFESSKENFLNNLNIKAAKLLNYPFLISLDKNIFLLKKDSILKTEKSQIFITLKVEDVYDFPDYKIIKGKILNSNVNLLDFDLKKLEIAFFKVKKDINLKDKITLGIRENCLIPIKTL